MKLIFHPTWRPADHGLRAGSEILIELHKFGAQDFNNTDEIYLI